MKLYGIRPQDYIRIKEKEYSNDLLINLSNELSTCGCGNDFVEIILHGNSTEAGYIAVCHECGIGTYYADDPNTAKIVWNNAFGKKLENDFSTLNEIKELKKRIEKLEKIC